MGVPGSPWKMYIDPAEDVLCYHNFQTGEKIFDYQMKDKKLREISIAGITLDQTQNLTLQRC